MIRTDVRVGDSFEDIANRKTEGSEFKKVLEAQMVIEEYDKKHNLKPPQIIDPASYTDLGNAKRFVCLHQRNIRYVKKWKCWMVWDGKRWVSRDIMGMVPLVEEMITSMYAEANAHNSSDESEKLRKHARGTEALTKIMATIQLSQGQPGMTAEPDDFDKNKYLINVMNGTINLHSGEFREFRREDMLTQMTNVVYDENATAPVWDKFLARIMDNDVSMISFLQRAAGYALTGDCSEECIFMLYGTGANGKSKFIDALAFMMGQYSKKTAVHTVMEMKNESALSSDVAALKGVRFAYASEPNKGKRLDEGKIKDMTGREKIPCCRKFCEPEEYQPHFKLFISFNHKPVIKSVDNGIQRRIRFIPFDVKIPDSEKDMGLDEKLHAEAPGILNWVLSGVKAWQDIGLGFPDKAKKATETYFDEMDTLGEYIDDCCELDPASFTPFDIIYESYINWCELSRNFVMSGKNFSQSLNERDIRSKKVQGIRGKIGLKLKNICPSVLPLPTPKNIGEDALDRNLSHRSSYRGVTHMNDVVSNVSNVSKDNYILINSQSVQSVQSVNNINNLTMKIIELLDKINKPDTINELSKLKEDVIFKIMCLPEYDELNDETLKRIVDEYCKSRGWQ